MPVKVQECLPAETNGGRWKLPGRATTDEALQLFDFNLEGMATICWVLSTTGDNLWEFTLPDGRNMRKAVQFLYPYIVDKSKWPYAKDVMHFDAFPARQPFLLFAGIALGEPNYFETWKKLDADSKNEEVRRSIPIRQPVLWVQ